MARTDALQGALPLLVLTILARRGPLHGYAITTHIEQISGSILRVEEGSLYPALHRMEEAGLIKARWTTTEHNRRARTYEITTAGRKELGVESSKWQTITGAIAQVLQEA